MDARRHDVKPGAAALLYLSCLALPWLAQAAAADKPRKGKALHGALAYHQASGAAGWATDRPSSREAKLEALRQCGHEKCVVVASFSSGCGALAKSPARFVVQRGVTQQEAETKALERCGKDCRIAAWTCTR